MRDEKGRFIKGHKHSKEALQKISKSSKGRKSTQKQLEALKLGWGLFKGKKIPQITGNKHPAWKGDNVGNNALHSWIKRNLGTPMVCEFCKKVSDNKIEMHWANKDHKYRRNLEDWLRLCASCHKQHDYNHKLVAPKNKSLS